MVTFIAWGVALIGALAPRSTGAWIDEDFERYRNHAELLAAWPEEKGRQDSRQSQDQFLGPGHCSFWELSNEDSRHLRVFDPTNSVTGTDDQPLRFIYYLFISQKPYATFRCCEVLNSETHDRIALGPFFEGTHWQVFDGMRWRDLVYAPERSLGWNGLEMVIKTDVLYIRVFNAKGSAYEEIPRATRSGFGVFAIGSGKANKDSPSFVDNVRVDGGTVYRQDADAGRSRNLSPACEELLRRANDAVQAYYEGRSKPGDVLTFLETLLEDAGGKMAASSGEDTALVLPWIYERIASIKVILRTQPVELESVHYEAVARSPDGIGSDVAIRNLSESLAEPSRASFLLNIATTYSDKRAGRAAAKILVDRPTEESASVGARRCQALVQRGAGTPVPEAIVDDIVRHGTIDENDEQVRYLLSVLKDDPFGVAILRRHGERLIQERQWDRIQQLAEWAAAEGSPVCSEQARSFLVQARMESRDVWGAMAVVAGLPLGDERATLLSQLAGMNQPSAIQGFLSKIVSQAVKLGCSIEPPAADASVPDSPEAILWEAIATSAERAGIPRVAAAAYQHLASPAKPASATDGSSLAVDFASANGDPEQLARFWKAHYLVLRKRPWEAEGLFAGLAATEGSGLRAQAAFDLARLRQQLHRPECATQPASLCESLLPTSVAIHSLKDSLTRDLANQEEQRRLHEEVGRAWAWAEEVRDPQQAAGALMSAAELEMRLGLPERAVEALEALLAKYPDAPSLPAALVKLAKIYKEQMGLADKSQALLDRLARDFPEYAAGLKTGP